RLTTKFLHEAQEFAAGLLRQQIAVKCYSSERSGDGAVGADQPEIESQLLRDGQGEGVAASSDQDDLNALRVHSPESREIGFGNLKFRVEQGPVNINRDEAEGIGGHK